jgi:DNA-binding MarR family transcriptional regulator
MGRDGRIARDPEVANETDDELALDTQLFFALCTANNRLVRVYGAALGPLGLTVPQTLILMALWETSPRQVGNIAQTLDLDNGSITPVLKRLEAGGFVTRVRDTVDERRVHVHITEKGRAVREPILLAKRRIVAEVGAPQAELDVLMAGLTRLSQLLSAVYPSTRDAPSPLVRLGADRRSLSDRGRRPLP